MTRIFIVVLLVAAVIATAVSFPQEEKRGLRVGHSRVRGRLSPWIRYNLYRKMAGARARKVGKRMPGEVEAIPNEVKSFGSYKGKPNATDIAEDFGMNKFLRKLLPFLNFATEQATVFNYDQPDNVK